MPTLVYGDPAQLIHAQKYVARYRVQAGIVDEQLLARNMALAHGGRQPLHPRAVMLAIGGIPIPVIRVTRAIFFPKKAQGHARALQLPVDFRPVRFHERIGLRARHLVEKLPFKSILIDPYFRYLTKAFVRGIA